MADPEAPKKSNKILGLFDTTGVSTIIGNKIFKSMSDVSGKDPKRYMPESREHPLHKEYRDRLFIPNSEKVKKVKEYELFWDEFTDTIRLPLEAEEDTKKGLKPVVEFGPHFDMHATFDERSIIQGGSNIVLIANKPEFWHTQMGKLLMQCYPDNETLRERYRAFIMEHKAEFIQFESLIRKVLPEFARKEEILSEKERKKRDSVSTTKLEKILDRDEKITDAQISKAEERLRLKLEEQGRTIPIKDQADHKFMMDFYHKLLDGSNCYVVPEEIGLFQKSDKTNWTLKSIKMVTERNKEDIPLYVYYPQPQLTAIKHKDGRVQCFLNMGKDNTGFMRVLFHFDLDRVKKVVGDMTPDHPIATQSNIDKIKEAYKTIITGLKGLEDSQKNIMRPILRDSPTWANPIIRQFRAYMYQKQFTKTQRIFRHRYRFAIPRRYAYLGLGKSDGRPKFLLLVPGIPCKLERGEVPISESDTDHVLNASWFDPKNEDNITIRGGNDDAGMPLELSDKNQHDLGPGNIVLQDTGAWQEYFYKGDTTVRRVSDEFVNEGFHGYPTMMEIMAWIDLEIDNYRDDMRDGRWHPTNTTAYEYSRLMHAHNTNMRNESGATIHHKEIESDGQRVRELLKEFKVLKGPDSPSHLNPCFDWKALNEASKYPFRHVGNKNYYDNCTYIQTDLQHDPHTSTRGLAKYLIERFVNASGDYFSEAVESLKHVPKLGEVDFGPGKYRRTYTDNVFEPETNQQRGEEKSSGSSTTPYARG
ncbi:MAG: hypothetical protein V1735_02310 [Nanoarchaeota archaeon]